MAQSLTLMNSFQMFSSSNMGSDSDILKETFVFFPVPPGEYSDILH